jgi:hypothetical protein
MHIHSHAHACRVPHTHAQIAKEAKQFAKPMGINALAVFGGSGAAEVHF